MNPVWTERSPILVLASLALAATAGAQSFNLDVGANTLYPVPADAYGGAAGQPGRWNAATAVVGPAIGLVDLAGVATGATVDVAGGNGNYQRNHPDTAGDVQNLMDDVQDVGVEGSSSTWTFSGLENGLYTVWTYGWAPDEPDGGVDYLTAVSVICSTDLEYNVGSDWAPPDHALGFTFGVHKLEVQGGTLSVHVRSERNYGSVNGFQLKQEPLSGEPFCPGGGACPCAGNLPGHGCQNSFGTGGGLLAGFGTASVTNDTLVLAASFLPTTTTTLFIQGEAEVAPFASGDGQLCTGVNLIRLGPKAAQCGRASFPDTLGFDPRISVRGAIPATGGTRYYQAFYRNAAPYCVAATFNFTSGWKVTWAP